jgi:FkbM family methyltransferase
VARPILVRGVFEEAETALLRRLLRPGMRVIDVGANLGYYSVLASRLVGPGGKVLAIEAEPGNFALLERNLAENGCTNVEAFQLALSDAPGRVALHTDRSNRGNPSLVGANVPDRGGAVEVEAMTLDAFLAGRGAGRIDLVKMDVQGAEGRVLAGAQALLAQPGLRVLLELWPRGLENAGTDAGAMLRGLASAGFTVQPVESEQPLSVEGVLAAVARSRDGFLNVLFVRA